MDAMSLEVYRSRASQLANAIKLCAEDYLSYASAVALLAVHSAISFNDALLIRLTGGRPKGVDHKNAIRSTKKVCEKAKVESAGLKHLEKLLNAKSDVSYGDRVVEAEYAQTLKIAAERFQAWVEKNLANGRTIQ